MIWKIKFSIGALCLLFAVSLITVSCGRQSDAPADPHVIRCAVIGGAV